MKNEIIGFAAENQMIETLNKKCIKDLNDNLAKMLRSLFPGIKDDTTIECKKVEGFYKPDFVIICEGKEKYISMKSGNSDSIHEEQLPSFITFLHRLGISKETLDTIKLFQYGDGTTDGTGKVKMGWRDVYNTYADRIKKANYELNQNKRRLLMMLDRFLYQGVNIDAKCADAIYHGSVDDGIVIRKEQIDNYIVFKKWNYDSFHIGPLILKPRSRFIGFEEKDIRNEHLRHKIQLRWPRIKEDFQYINRYHTGRKPR